MSKKLKVLAFVLAALMVVTVFASCGKKEEVGGSSAVMTESEIGNENTDKEGDVDADGDKDKDDNNQTANESGSTKSKSKSGKKTIKVNATGWPIVDDKLTISVLGFARPAYTEYSKMDFAKYMEKKSNIAIKYTGVDEGKMNERKTLAIQSGDLPDVFCCYWNTFSDYELTKYASEGTLMDLKDDIKKYAPNMQKALEDPTTSALNVAADGGVYTMPNRPTTKYSYASHFLNIRKSWLDNLGLDVPKTAQEFLEVMRAFRDDDPNKNGQNDEIPFALFNWSAKFIYAWWGICADDKSGIGIDQTGKAYYMHVIDNALGALKYWHTFCKEEVGLMDNTIVGKSEGYYAAYLKQINDGKVGCFWWSYMSSTYFPNPKLLNEYVAIPYPSAGFVNTKYKLCGSAQPFDSSPTRGSRLVTKKCQSVAAVLRYFDYFYTDEGIMIGNYGPESSGLYKKVSGGYQLTSKATADGMKKVAPANLMGISGPGSLTCNLDESAVSTEKIGDAYEKAASKTYEAATKQNRVIYFSEFPKTSSEITKLRKFEYFYDKGGYASRFVQGADNLADYTTFVNDLKQKGLDQYVAIHQQVITRNKKYLVG